MDDELGTHFLNVDLDVFSRLPMDPMIQAFGKKVMVLYAGRRGRRYSAHVELAGSGAETARQADRLVRRLVQLVRELKGRARTLWQEADRREFNLGIEAATRSNVFELRLQPETLDAVASVDGRIVITVYAPQRVRVANRKRTPPLKRRR